MRQYIAEGIDISKHNGNINMKAVRDQAGIKHVVIRAGYGQNNIDQQFVKNAEAAVNLGMNTAFYWFSYALNGEMARQEALYCIDAVKKYFSKCAICYDAEYDTRTYAAKKGVNLTKIDLTEMAFTFLKEVKSNGYYPILYTNNDYTKNYFDIPKLKENIPDLYIWYARYGKEDDNIYDLPVDMWQYSSSGHVAGISNKVDMNYIYREYNADNPYDSILSLTNPQNTTAKTGTNLYIKWFQIAYSHDFGDYLEPDGIDGPKTQAARKKVLLRKGHNDKISTNLITFLQGALKDRGYYHGGLDGIYGDKTYAAVRMYQEANNLEVDGIAGYETLTSLFY